MEERDEILYPHRMRAIGFFPVLYVEIPSDNIISYIPQHPDPDSITRSPFLSHFQL